MNIHLERLNADAEMKVKLSHEERVNAYQNTVWFETMKMNVRKHTDWER